MTMPLDVKAKWWTGARDAEGDKIYKDTTIAFNFGETIDEAVELFGNEAVYDQYLANARIQFQNAIRAHGEAGVEPDEIAAKVADFKVGEKASKVVADPVAVLKQRYQAAETDEDKASILAQIMGTDEA